VSDDERTETKRLSNDGRRIIIVERWLDRQVDPPRWRSKNWHRNLSSADIQYLRDHPDATFR
jgi:hypothetical protein